MKFGLRGEETIGIILLEDDVGALAWDGNQLISSDCNRIDVCHPSSSITIGRGQLVEHARSEEQSQRRS